MSSSLLVTLPLTALFLIWLGVVTDFIPTTDVHSSRDHAKEKIKGKIGLYFVASLVISILSVIAGVTVIGGILVAGALMCGFSSFNLKIARGEDVSCTETFSGFNKFGTSLGAFILGGLAVLFGSILIVPGFILFFSYSMVWYIIQDHPEMSAVEALRESRKLMRGHKKELLGLIISAKCKVWGIVLLIEVVTVVIQMVAGISLFLFKADGGFVAIAIIVIELLSCIGVLLYDVLYVTPVLQISKAKFYDQISELDKKEYVKFPMWVKKTFGEAFSIVKKAVSMKKSYIKLYAGYFVSGVLMVAVALLCIFCSTGLGNLINNPELGAGETAIKTLIYITVGCILPSFIISPLVVGLSAFYMNEVTGKKARFADLFSGFSKITSNFSFIAKRVVLTSILYVIVYVVVYKCILLGIYDIDSAVIIVDLIIYIAVYWFTMHYDIVPYVMAEEPHLSSKEAIDKAKRLMQNVKTDYLKTLLVVALINIVAIIFAIIAVSSGTFIGSVIAIALEVVMIPFNILCMSIFYRENAHINK
ncbi:DUF975 family protein [Treponema sp.]|uniref:DUF975 family protein n=1 Tax=Treponema sp. TaxID=166 RepID=UPI00298D690E|nr:DUF975 family protein [Treponema sp.]